MQTLGSLFSMCYFEAYVNYLGNEACPFNVCLCFLKSLFRKLHYDKYIRDTPFLLFRTGMRKYLLRSYIKGSHDFLNGIKASPLCSVAKPFLRGKRQSTDIYDYR